MKKIFVIVLGVLMLASGTFLFAGGGSQPAAARTGKVTVQFWHSQGGSAGGLLESAVAKFNETHADSVEVVPTFQGGYWESASKAMAAASAGQNPDLLQMGADHVSIFASEGTLVDLVPYMQKTGVDPKDFVDGFVWDYRVNNGAGMVAIPCGRSTPILYVNTEMFAAEGLKIPVTWDEWKTTANALVRKQGSETTRYGFAMPSNDTWYWFMAVAQAGGKFINDQRTGLGCVDDGSAVAAFTYWQDLNKSGGMYYADSGSEAIQMFVEGKAGMLIQSVGSMNEVANNAKFKWDAAYVPRGKAQVVPTGGNAIGMLEASKQKDAAWTFLDWFLKNPDGQVAYVIGTGYLPVTQTMAASALIKQEWARVPQKQTAYSQLQFANDRGHRVPQVGELMNPLLDLAQAVMYDNADVKTQVDILARNVADIMRNN